MLHFSIALPCEAQGIIRKYGLKSCGGHARAQFFEGEYARLAVTGVGILASAIATTALGTRFPDKTAIWLNVGICGHLDAPIGKLFIANRISSESSRDRLYPQLPWKSELDGIDLLTLDEPSIEYQAGQAFDMEGFGFYKAALAFAPTEFVQCLKVVSDNASHPATTRFDKDTIARNIENQLPAIETLCAAIEQTRPRERRTHWSRNYASSAKARFSFTETESHQLNRRLAQLDILLDENEKAAIQLLEESPNKKRFLSQLQSRIDHASSRSIC